MWVCHFISHILRDFYRVVFLHNSEVATIYLLTFSLDQWHAVTDTCNC